LDDGRSDAKTVTLAVIAKCSWKRELAIAELMKVPSDPDAKKGAADGVRSAELANVISTVLEIRTNRREGRRNSWIR
jgi:hypothetical protein